MWSSGSAVGSEETNRASQTGRQRIVVVLQYQTNTKGTACGVKNTVDNGDLRVEIAADWEFW